MGIRLQSAISAYVRRKSGVAEDERWITVHPGGKYSYSVVENHEKGQPVLLDDNGKILGGMGGKFNGMTMGQAIQASKSPARLIQEEYEENRNREFWERLWGGISTHRLGAADPDMIKRLRTGGYKFVFAERGGGETIEDLVSELEEEGFLDYGSTVDDLLNLILSKEPPDAKTRARWKAQKSHPEGQWSYNFESVYGKQPSRKPKEQPNQSAGSFFDDDPDRPYDVPF